MYDDIVLPPPDSWRARPILPQLAAAGRAPHPTLLTLSDGTGLLYPGKLSVIFGDSETGKTWLALLAASQQVALGESVIYLDFEDDLRTMGERLLALGLHDPGDLFHYARVEDPINPGQLETLLEEWARLEPTLVVIDSMDELLAMHGASSNSNDDVRRVRQEIIDPLQKLGAAVVVIDHTNKTPGSRGSTGAKAKLAQVNGAMLRVETVKPWGRGVDGRANIRVEKDRMGHLRGRALDGTLLAVAHFLSEGDLLNLRIDPPPTHVNQQGDAEYSHDWLLEQIVEVLAAQPGQMVPSNQALIEALREHGVNARTKSIQDARTQGVEKGVILQDGRAFLLPGNNPTE